MKEEILSRFQGQYCSIDDIVTFVEELGRGSSRKTVIWHVNEFIRQGKAFRFGRGVYGFVDKAQFRPVISEAAQRACSILNEQFKYLVLTVSDSNILGHFMNLQPFSTVVVIEVKKSAIGAVIAALRKEGVDACLKKDYPMLERYVLSSQAFIIRPELSVNPKLPQENNIRMTSLEKILVDLACDEDIYGHYQGEELQTIYQNATNRYVVNYSQMLKYAEARKKKAAVLGMLQDSDVFNKIRMLL